MNSFAKVQQLGRALMLPIAVLPVAGLLLRLGQPDVIGPVMHAIGLHQFADIKWIAQAGGAIFDNLALLFAIGVAVGFARDNHGAAGLASAVGFLIFGAVLKTINDKIDMGVLGGILIGLVAGGLYNRYKDIKLPDYLAFFGGRRFIPIITGLSSLVLALLCGIIWPPVQAGINSVGQWIIASGAIGVFIYGALNRLLIVTGLHHIINSLVWFVFGSFQADGKTITGDLHRFFAHDPTAGTFMAGFFPVMMFGLPAACLAMYHAAKPENRKAVGGLLISMGLTSFLTGVTEPVEFTFMFLAPFLYVIHAVLTALSLSIMQILNCKLGFTFSAGAIDYFLNYNLSTNGWLLWPIGAIYFAVYYGLFRWAISRFNLPTPGRDAIVDTAAAPILVTESVPVQTDEGTAFVQAFGGRDNVKYLDACTTRLRLEVRDPSRVNETALKSLGSRGMIRGGGGSMQVVVGPKADMLADIIRQRLQLTSDAPAKTQLTVPDSRTLLAALGGTANLLAAEQVAGTRVRVVLKEPEKVDEGKLKEAGAQGLMRLNNGVVHIVAGEHAAAIATALQTSVDSGERADVARA